MVITDTTYIESAKTRNNGSILVLAVFAIFILSILGLGVLTLAYGSSMRSIQIRNETAAKLAAEAGYEKAIWLMSNQNDVLSWLGSAPSGDAARAETSSGQLSSAPNIDYDYSISFDRFENMHPIYKIEATGSCSLITRTITAFVAQRIGGWEMGKCEVPTGSHQTIKVPFTGDDDIVNMPIHINPTFQFPNRRDMPIDEKNRPRFRELVSMSEHRYGSRRTGDKYAGIMDVFEGGIYFNQPENKITRTGGDTIQKKVDRFLNSTHNRFRFYGGNGKKPIASVALYLPVYPTSAVQLEFFVDTTDNTGKVRITNNCTVICVDGSGYDYKLAISSPQIYERYPVYSFHYADDNQAEIHNLTDTYVKQQAKKPNGSVVSAEAGGQIYVDGNVIIGGEIDENGRVRIGFKPCPALIKGKVTVVATGNIWIVSPVVYHGHQDTSSGFTVPATYNPNILGLFSVNGVIKVVDAGLSINVPRDPNDNDLPRVFTDPNGLFRYHPICLQEPTQGKIYLRQLPEPMVVQASVTVGGGGFGVENVFARMERKTVNNLVLAGSITEVIQGLVASSIGEAGFKKHYYFDKRLQNGILPGDVWFQSKYIPIIGGWADTRQ